MKKPTKKQLIKLAQILNEEIETLETRGLDDLDFFETAVWNTKSALINSYNMGYEKALKEIEKKEQQNAK
ncbi:MAG: hypothetical protein GY793_11230 [Proteobacteria bacterium]|nr:hypothetical protein [Pseudomonadota bacterium]